MNLYFTLKIVKNCQVIEPSTKLFMLLLAIPTIFIVPILTFFGVLIGSVVTYFIFTAAGYPFGPWMAVEDHYGLFWKFYVIKAEAFVENYGNATGIPDNWDGRMYGGIYNPLVLSFAIFLLCYGVIAMPIAVATIVLLKFIPVYLKIQWKAAKMLNPLVVMPQYWFPLFVIWFKAGTFKNYVKILASYVEILKEGCQSLCSTDDPECPCEIKILCCWWIYIPLFGLWLLCWPFVLVAPFFAYIFWLYCTIMVGPTIWMSALFASLMTPFVVGFSLIFFSPFLCVRCPSVALKYHSTVRAGLGRSLSYGFWEPFHFALYMDEASTELTTCGCKLIPIDNRHERQVVFGRIPVPESTWVKDKSTQKKVKYWDLYFAKVQKAKQELLDLNWISADNVESMSPNFLQAVPAITIGEIICASIRKNKNNKSLIYWDGDNECDDFSRDRNDNIVSYFWPKLMAVKQSFIQVANIKPDGTRGTKEQDVEMGSMTNQLLEEEIKYIKAQLCSGENDQDDNQKKVLANALKDNEAKFDKSKITELNRIVGSLVDIVLSLHRVQEMKNRLSQLCID